MARFWLVLSLSLFVASFSVAQTSTVSDLQALTLAERSIAAMTAGSAVSDVTLSGSATWVAGSDTETGPATLTAKGTTESRVDLNLSGGERTEVRSSADGSPQGDLIKDGGAATVEAAHNCFTDTAWFFPPLSSLAELSVSGFLASYMGQESLNGIAVQHLRIWQSVSSQDASAAKAIIHLSTIDWYLDSATFLPVAAKFTTHPPETFGVDMPVEILFSNYQRVNGVLLPLHIQKLLNGGLTLDLTISSAVLNSGLSDSDFNLQ